MALDYFAIASYGVYPTPTPTNSRRAALACSHGLLNIDLPGPTAAVGTFLVKLGRTTLNFLKEHTRMLWVGNTK